MQLLAPGKSTPVQRFEEPENQKTSLFQLQLKGKVSYYFSSYRRKYARVDNTPRGVVVN